MKISHKILFIGFKNKASFIFIAPLIRIFLSNKRKKSTSINVCLKPSLLFNFLSQKVFVDFSNSIKDKSFKVIISMPDFEDFFSILNGSNVLSNLLKYFILEYILLIPISLFYFFSFRRIPFFITNSDLVSTNKFNLLLLSGTNHISGSYLLSRIFSNPNPKYKMIWLPHAPHNGSSLIELPKVLQKSKIPIDFWLPLPVPSHDNKITNSNISTFVSGDPPFCIQQLRWHKNLILNKKIDSQKHNLIILLRKTEIDGVSAQDSTYDYQQTIELLRNLSEFSINNNFSKVSFCLHPSTISSRLKFLIEKFNWPKYKLTYNYFLSLANKNSLVIGSYSSVLLHSAFLGFKTICLKDHIVKRLAKEEPNIFKLYKNSPINFCDIDSRNLSSFYKSVKVNSFENFSNFNYMSEKYYLLKLANDNFLKSIERIYELSKDNK